MAAQIKHINFTYTGRCVHKGENASHCTVNWGGNLLGNRCYRPILWCHSVVFGSDGFFPFHSYSICSSGVGRISDVLYS